MILKKYKYFHIALNKIKKYITSPKLAIRDYRNLQESKELKEIFLEKIFNNNKKELEKYSQEVIRSGLVDELLEKRNLYEKVVKGKTYRGSNYNMGTINFEAGTLIYSLIRKFQPEKLVETGVCNGVSTAFILLALEKNGKGKLHSIDYPEVVGTEYKEGEFWEEKGGASIPKDKTPGWVIPENLKDNWELILGKSQDELPPLLERLKDIDFFMHDSEHTYECMMFEFQESLKKLNKNGLILSDNINSNDSFYDFCSKNDLELIRFHNIMGLAFNK